MFSVFHNSEILTDRSIITLNKEQILNSTIKSLSIYVTPLKIVNNALQIMFYNLRSIRSAIAQNVNHTASIIRTDDDFLILIEYGAYDKDNMFYYYKEDDGLRFIQISDSIFMSLMNDGRNACVHCNIQNEISIRDLLFQTETINGFNRWDKNSYNLITHNCQYFVKCVMKVLGATKDFSVNDKNIPILIQTELFRNEFSNDNLTKLAENFILIISYFIWKRI